MAPFCFNTIDTFFYQSAKMTDDIILKDAW